MILQQSKEKWRRHYLIRRDRLRAARKKATHIEGQWDELLLEFGCRCVKCSKKGRLIKDHIIPLYQGGSDGIDNLQPLCVKCNRAKGPETINWRKFRKQYGWMEDDKAYASRVT